MSNDSIITVDIADGGDYSCTTSIDTSMIMGDISIGGSMIAPPYLSSFSSPQWTDDNNNLVLGQNSSDECGADIFICEEWETKKPIKIKEGMFASFKEDLYSVSELQEMVYNKIEEDYPEKAIKLGLNKDSLTLRKHSIPIEITIKD